MKTLPVLFLVVAFSSCTKDPAPAPPAKPAADKPKGPDGAEYTVALVPRAPYAAGKEAGAAITVAAKPGYHVNAEYPMVFKPEGHAGVRFAEDRLKLTWGAKTPCAENAEDACAVEAPIALTPEKAGPATVAGTIAFSVCNPKHCLIEKVPLTLAIEVQ